MRNLKSWEAKGGREEEEEEEEGEEEGEQRIQSVLITCVSLEVNLHFSSQPQNF